MSLSLRRVVTGHDEKGKAVVLIDEIMNDARSMRPNHQGHGIWATDDYPANLNSNLDGK